MQGWARAAWIRAWFTLTVWVGVPLGALTAMVEVGSQGWGALGLVRLIAATVVTSLVQIPLEVGLVVLAGGLLGFAVARPTSPRSLAGGLVLSALVAAWPAWRVMAVVRPWIREAVFRYTEHASDEVRTALLLLWALADSGEALLLIGGWAVAGSVWASGWWTTAEWTALVQRLDRPRAALGLAVPAVIAAGLALALSTSRASGPDVVVIVLDTVRADRLDLYGHERATAPRLRELATDAVWYRNAVAPSPWTTPSVAALLTGRHGSRFGYLDRPVRLPASTLTVPEALANAGWRTDAVVSNLYASSLAGFDQGFDAWDERDAQGADHISSASVTDKALAALAAAPVGPWFLWAHYYDPHCAYADHPEVQFSDPQYRGPVVPLMNCQTLEDDANTLTSADLQQVTAYYDEEIRHTDHHMGRLLDGLKEAGRYDGALIVVVADHGEAFSDRPDRFIGHSISVYQELLHVPLLVKWPDQWRAGTVEDTRVTLMDVAATIIEAATLPWPVAHDGQSLRRPEPRPLVAETRYGVWFRAAFLDGWKLIVNVETGERELYHLDSDPGEVKNLAAARPHDVLRLAKVVEDWVDDIALDHVELAPAVVTDEEAEMLKQLGYTAP